MDNILVLQLARMGDFLQTTPLLWGIKKMYPACRIHVLVDKAVQSVAARCPAADIVYTIDTALLSEMLTTSHDISELYDHFKYEFNFLHHLNFDMMCNLNLSPITTLLSSIPAAKNRCGYGLSEKRTTVSKSPLFAFFNTLVKYAPLAPFNLVDYFYYTLCTPEKHPRQLSFKMNSADVQSAALLLFHENIKEEDCVIAFQLGTRHEQRQWPIKYYYELAVKLLEHDDMHIVLLGANQERMLGEEITHLMSTWDEKKRCRVHNFIGNTTLGELAGIIMRANLLVTGDTGTMHLASSVGTQILALFFGPACAYYTGPYGPDNYVLHVKYDCAPCVEGRTSCHEYKCKYAIKPESVASIIHALVLNQEINDPSTSDFELLKSGFDTWGITYTPVGSRQLTMSDIQFYCYREIAKRLIDNTYEPQPAEINRFYKSFIHDHRIRSAIQCAITHAQVLANEFHTHSGTMSRFLLDEKLAFWHPWIDCCDAFKKNTWVNTEERHQALTSLVSGLSVVSNTLNCFLMN